MSEAHCELRSDVIRRFCSRTQEYQHTQEESKPPSPPPTLKQGSNPRPKSRWRKKREQDICSRGGCSSIDLWIMCVSEETFSSTQGVVASSVEVVMKMKEGGVTKKTFSKYWNVTPNLSTFGLLFNQHHHEEDRKIFCQKEGWR